MYLVPCLTWLGWDSAALTSGGTLVDNDEMYPCIPWGPGEGQGGSRWITGNAEA